MKQYTCNVVLMADMSGNPLHVISNKTITEMEMRVLRALHGKDALRDIKEIGEVDIRDERAEMCRLARLYGDSGGFIDMSDHPGLKLIQKVFGVELYEFDQYLQDAQEAELQEREDRQRERDARFAASRAAEAFSETAQRMFASMLGQQVGPAAPLPAAAQNAPPPPPATTPAAVSLE